MTLIIALTTGPGKEELFLFHAFISFLTFSVPGRIPVCLYNTDSSIVVHIPASINIFSTHVNIYSLDI